VLVVRKIHWSESHRANLEHSSDFHFASGHYLYLLFTFITTEVLDSEYALLQYVLYIHDFYHHKVEIRFMEFTRLHLPPRNRDDIYKLVLQNYDSGLQQRIKLTGFRVTDKLWNYRISKLTCPHHKEGNDRTMY